MATKKTKKKVAAKATVAKKAPSPSAKGSKRIKWLDDKSGAVLIDGYARKLTTFMDTIADGAVDDGEVKEQEARLVKLMKEVEPKLDDALHARVTQLLCELTAYDIMQILNTMQKARPKRRFRG